MIWQIHEQTFENKGMISGHHGRSIYSCSWSKGTIPVGDSQQQVDLVATGGADNKIMVYELNRESLLSGGTASFEFNIVAQQLMAHSNDVNAVAFHPKKPLTLASCSDDCTIKLWKITLE